MVFHKPRASLDSIFPNVWRIGHAASCHVFFKINIIYSTSIYLQSVLMILILNDTKISWIILNTLELVLMTRGAGSPHDEGDDNKGRNKTKNENRESTSARRRTTPPPTTTKMTRTGKGVTYASGNYDFRGSLLLKKIIISHLRLGALDTPCSTSRWGHGGLQGNLGV